MLKPGPCPKSTRLDSLGWSLGKAHLNKFPGCWEDPGLSFPELSHHFFIFTASILP